MNIFSCFEAHRNPVVGLIDRLDKKCKNNPNCLTIRFIILLGKLVAILLPVLFAIEEILSFVYLKIKGKKEFHPLPERKKELSVIILNWNGRDILPSCLDHLRKALDNVPGDHEIIVVDNGSEDGSVGILKKDFPQVKTIELKKNIGFSRGNNKGVDIAKNDLIVLLNNDIFLSEEAFSGLLHHFDDNRVFAVAPKVVLEDGSLNEGHSWGSFDEGILRFYNERQSSDLEVVKKPALTLYPIGACAIMDRKLYRKLGGLDAMLSPFYWEDDDLGYRAFKRGYKIIYDPQVSVVHKNAATSKKLPGAYINTIKEKNMLLFLWRNLTDKPYLKEYLKSLPRRINFAVERRNCLHIASYLFAFLQAGEVMRRRVEETPYIRLSDKKALTLTRRERVAPRPAGKKPHILLLTPFLPYPPNNGGAMRIYSLTKQLKGRFDFTLVSFVDNKALVNITNECRELFRDIHLVERKCTPFEGLKMSEIPEAYSHYISTAMARTVENIVRKNGIDIFQVEFPWMAYYARFVHNKPSIFVEHDVGNMFYGQGIIRPEKGLERLLSPLKAINYERTFVDAFDHVVTVTEEDKGYFKTLFPETSVTAIEQGVDTEKFQYQYSSNGVKNLVYLGHYKHYPNEDAVVYFVEEILPLIKKRHNDVRLHLVGSHPTRKINRLKVREDIIVTGSVPDVTSYLNKGTVFIAPIRKGRGLKGKLLEAMALGLPVVATPVAAAGVGARDGEEILIAETPEKFADKVSTLLTDRTLREEISLKGRRLVEERFDWKILADRMEIIYRELIGENRWM